MEARLAVARRIMQAKGLGVPSLIATFPNIMITSVDSLIPLVLVATEDVLALNERNHIEPWTTWQARPLIADAVALRWASIAGIRDPDRILARTYGELVGISAAAGKSTVVCRDNARRRLEEIILQCPPNINDVRSWIAEIVRQVAAASGALVPLNESSGYVPGNQQVSDQTFRFYLLRGHMLPAEMFENAESARIWTQLSDLGVNHVDIGEHIFDLVERFNEPWAGMDPQCALGYYEGKAQQNLDKSRGLIAGAIFTYIATLAKNINMTPAWVQRRKLQFQNMLGDLVLDSYITESTCTNFAKMYRRTEAEWEHVYTQLAVCWSQLQVAEGLSLTWVIEQAANNNVTCLTTIADVVTKPFSAHT